VRRASGKQTPLPDEEVISDLDDAETPLAERLDGADYRDDVLRLLFICCHPDLPATQQIALALRIVSGLSVKQIARAFLVGEAAMEQRITRAKARIAKPTFPSRRRARSSVPSGSPVAAMIYLVFNEGYSDNSAPARAAVRRGDPPGAAAAAPVPGRARDHGPHRAAAAAARSRAPPASIPTARHPARRPGPQPLEPRG
jgi:predicted RNA polymerase sigma factor